MWIPALLSAFFVSFAGAAALKRLAKKWNFVSRPQGERWRIEPIPLLGGVAVASGSVIGGLLFGFSFFDPKTAAVVVLSLAGLVIGIYDDKYCVAPQAKLTAQILLGLIAVGIGIRFSLTGSLFLDGALTLFWIVLVVNAFNLMDNMDGLAAGVAAIISAFLLILFLKDAPAAAAVIAGALVGSLAGFLIHNFSPASIFLGDAGSLFIGFMLSLLSVIANGGSVRQVTAVVAVPLLIFLIPILDTTFVFIARLFVGRSPFQGGRDHTSHRLVVAGLSERQAVIGIYCFAGASGALALFFRSGGITSLLFILGFAILLLVYVMYLAHIRVYPEDKFEEEPLPAALGELGTLGAGGADPAAPRVFLKKFIPYKRQILSVVLDGGLICLAFTMAHVLRFEDRWIDHGEFIVRSLPIVVFCQISGLFASQAYRTLWRYTSLYDFAAIAKGVALGVFLSYAGIGIVQKNFMGSVMIIDGMLLLSFLCAARFAFRLLDKTFFIQNGVKKSDEPAVTVLIYGAGDRGEMLVRNFAAQKAARRQLLGFIDDNRHKIGARVHGLRVLGTNAVLEDLITQYKVKELIVSSAKINGRILSRVRECCQKHGVTLLAPQWKLELFN